MPTQQLEIDILYAAQWLSPSQRYIFHPLFELLVTQTPRCSPLKYLWKYLIWCEDRLG